MKEQQKRKFKQFHPEIEDGKDLLLLLCILLVNRDNHVNSVNIVNSVTSL